MRVLVCGGRDYADRAKVFAALDRAWMGDWGLTHVIEGGARGADALAAEWARKNLPPESHLRFPAQWDKHGKSAGHIRNHQMLVEGKPDMVIAFPGGRGTGDMKRKARRAGVKVIEFK